MQVLNDIERLFRECGSALYEMGAPNGVSQYTHALQTAALAEQHDASDALVAAALLHDLGHLLHDRPEGEMLDEHDDVHQYLALPFLRPWFDDAVLMPIKLHVDAKRYLCATEPAYWQGLSAGSRHSLELQGGPFTPDAVAAFLEQPHATDAVALRRWDDQAKNAAASAPDWAHFRPRLERALRPGAA